MRTVSTKCPSKPDDVNADLTKLRTVFISHEDGLDGKSPDYEVKENPSRADGYFLDAIDDPTFFEGRAAGIYLRLGGKVRRIGELGVLHPSVLEKFDLKSVAALYYLSMSLANVRADTLSRPLRSIWRCFCNLNG